MQIPYWYLNVVVVVFFFRNWEKLMKLKTRRYKTFAKGKHTKFNTHNEYSNQQKMIII